MCALFLLIQKETGRRVRLNDKLTPAFKFASQAARFHEVKLGSSPYIKIHKVKSLVEFERQKKSNSLIFA